MPEPRTKVTDRKFCTFTLDRYYFGIEVARVQEVIRHQDMTRVPLASQHIRGLINLRGQIVTAIDLRRRLQLPERSGDALPMNVVVRAEDGAVSLLVDEIDEVVEVDPNSFESTPHNLTAGARELIAGVFKFPSRLMLVLDVDAVLSAPTAASAS